MTLLNGRVTLGSEDERWALDLWAQNLTDEEYKQVAINAPLQGSAFQTTVQPNGTYYNPAFDPAGTGLDADRCVQWCVAQLLERTPRAQQWPGS